MITYLWNYMKNVYAFQIYEYTQFLGFEKSMCYILSQQNLAFLIVIISHFSVLPVSVSHFTCSLNNILWGGELLRQGALIDKALKNEDRKQLRKNELASDKWLEKTECNKNI